MVIFISRDHHYNHASFSSLKEGDIIKVKIIGHRFELYDEQISVLGELKDTSGTKPLSYGKIK